MVKADRTMIDAYYAQRGLVEPNATEDALWLVTELAELLHAYEYMLGESEDIVGFSSLTTSYRTHRIFERMTSLRGSAEKELNRMREGWVRNNQDQNLPDLAGEIADVYMMLDRFAKSLGFDDPQTLLSRKMARKGFTLDKHD